MNLSDLTLLSVSFNNNILTGMMLKSFTKMTNYEDIQMIIIDNGDKLPIDERMKEVVTVIDNFNHKLLSDEKQASRNHCKAIDYALKNCIKTKYVLLVDNDILFKPNLLEFLKKLDIENYDCVGEIGFDNTPPNRLFPHFCIIDVKKFNKENLNYFDRERIIWKGSICNRYDTGYSFYEDIKDSWKIKIIKISDVCIHLKGGMNEKKNVYDWLKKNESYYK